MAAADKIGPWRWDKGAATGSRAGHILPERAELGLRCGVMLSQGLLCVVAGTPPPAQDPPLPPQQKTARPRSPGSRPWPRQVLGGPWSARGPQGLGFPNLGLPSSGPHSCPCAPPGLSRSAPGNSPLQSPSAWMGIGLSCAPDRATYFLTPLFILLTSKISRRGENDPKRSEVCRDS